MLAYIPPRNFIRKQTKGVSFIFWGSHKYIYKRCGVYTIYIYLFQGYFILRINRHPTQQVFPSFFDTFYQKFIYFPQFSNKKKNLKTLTFEVFRENTCLNINNIIKKIYLFYSNSLL